ncbi:MAG: hypothetical protein ACOX6T_12475 [Myxococcales bacterium]|jgi:hypothetical protein
MKRSLVRIAILVIVGALAGLAFVEVRQSRCEAKVAELEAWYTALAEEGNRGFDLLGKGVQLVASKRRGRQFLAQASVEASRGVVQVNGAPVAMSVSDGQPLDRITEALVGLHGPGPARSPRLEAAKGADARRPPVPDAIALFIDRQTKWSVVCDLVEAVANAGYRRVLFVAEGTSAVIAPPRASNTERFESLARQASGVPAPVLSPDSPARERLYDECQPAVELLETYSRTNPLQVLARAPREIPAAIRACDCAVDFDAVKNQLWAQMGRFSGPALVDVPFTLADEGAAARVVEGTAQQPFEAVFPALEAAALSGEPLRLRATGR